MESHLFLDGDIGTVECSSEERLLSRQRLRLCLKTNLKTDKTVYNHHISFNLDPLMKRRGGERSRLEGWAYLDGVEGVASDNSTYTSYSSGKKVL